MAYLRGCWPVAWALRSRFNNADAASHVARCGHTPLTAMQTFTCSWPPSLPCDSLPRPAELEKVQELLQDPRPLQDKQAVVLQVRVLSWGRGGGGMHLWLPPNGCNQPCDRCGSSQTHLSYCYCIVSRRYRWWTTLGLCCGAGMEAAVCCNACSNRPPTHFPPA